MKRQIKLCPNVNQNKIKPAQKYYNVPANADNCQGMVVRSQQQPKYRQIETAARPSLTDSDNSVNFLQLGIANKLNDDIIIIPIPLPLKIDL